MAFAIMDETILYTVGRHEIGRYLLGCVAWLVFGARVVLANVNHSGLVSGLLTLFRLGYFGTIQAGGHIVPPPFLLYLLSNHCQTWHGSTIA